MSKVPRVSSKENEGDNVTHGMARDSWSLLLFDFGEEMVRMAEN